MRHERVRVFDPEMREEAERGLQQRLCDEEQQQEKNTRSDESELELVHPAVIPGEQPAENEEQHQEAVEQGAQQRQAVFSESIVGGLCQRLVVYRPLEPRWDRVSMLMQVAVVEMDKGTLKDQYREREKNDKGCHAEGLYRFVQIREVSGGSLDKSQL